MKNETITINIARDFSRFPVGRYRADGDYSGERFREGKLVPALAGFSHVIVEMDGTLGYGSSFLEEAFGGLVRVAGYGASALKANLEIMTDDAVLRETIWRYIREAESAKLTMAVVH